MEYPRYPQSELFTLNFGKLRASNEMQDFRALHILCFLKCAAFRRSNKQSPKCKKMHLRACRISKMLSAGNNPGPPLQDEGRNSFNILCLGNL